MLLLLSIFYIFIFFPILNIIINEIWTRKKIILKIKNYGPSLTVVGIYISIIIIWAMSCVYTLMMKKKIFFFLGPEFWQQQQQQKQIIPHDLKRNKQTKKRLDDDDDHHNDDNNRRVIIIWLDFIFFVYGTKKNY